MSKELRPLTSTLCKQRHQEYVDYIERNVLTKQSEVDTSVIAKDIDEFYGKLNVYGGQRQEKRAGINLIDVGKLKAVTKNGINFTPNEDGSININGTATNDTSYFLRDGTLALGIYTYKCFGLPDNLYADCWYYGNAYGEAVKKITSNVENRNYVIELKIPAETTLNVTIEPMLIAGEYTAETFPEYEPYGVMPSLQYPSEIQSVGDNIQLFDKDTMLLMQGLWISTISLAINRRGWYVVIPIVGGQTYTISRKIKETFYVTTTADYPQNNVTVVDSWKGSGNTNTYTINVSKEAKYLFLGLAAADSLTEGEKENIIADLKVEKGSKATAYSEFGQGSVEISTSNKNIAEINQKDWELTENNTIKNKSVTENKDLLIKKIKLKKGQVLKTRLVLFSKPLNSTTFTAYLNNRATVCQVLNYTNINNNEFELNKAYDRTYTAIEDCEIFYVCWGNANNDIFEFQFSASIDDNDLKYVVHKSKEYTLQTQQKMFEGDTFEKIDGVWYEKHTWLELVLDKEKINKLSQNTTDTANTYRYLYKLTENILQTDIQHATGYCTHFYLVGSGETYTKNKGFAVSQSTTDGKMYLCIYDEGETLAEFKSKIANENVTFYLQLEEAQYIKCTAEQCKILDKIDTYKDGTIITTDNDLCKISLRYKEDYGKRITALEKQISIATTVAE